MAEKKIKNIEFVLRKYISLLKKQIPVTMVILYGSYARGKPNEWSDIDLIVVSPAFHGGTKEDYLLLCRTARKITPQIEAIPYRPVDLEKYESGDFIDEILSTGKIIYKAAA